MSAAPEPTTPAGTSTERLFAWIDNAGKIVFGCVFWGSVLGAAALGLDPALDPFAVHGTGAIIGASLGFAAKRRGRWL